MRSIWIVVLTLALAACSGEPTVDTSTPDAYKDSYKVVSDGLEPGDRQKLAQAMLVILSAKASGADESPLGGLSSIAALAQNPQAMLDAIGPDVQGKTGKEIIAFAEQVKSDRLKNQLVRVNQDIAGLERELKGDRQSADAAKATLANVPISAPRYYWNEGRFLSSAIISFKIENKTKNAIKRVYLQGVLETPGRTIPWVDDGFNYEFKGGLEPGETQTLNLEPNRFGEWGDQSLKDKDNLILTLTLVNFEGADGQKVVAVGATSVAEKEARLKKLREDAVDLGKRVAGK